MCVRARESDIVLCICKSEREVNIECAQDAEDIAEALRISSSVYPDALAGPNSSRVLSEQFPNDLSISDQRTMTCEAISKSGVGSTITIRTRPLDEQSSHRQLPEDDRRPVSRCESHRCHKQYEAP